MGNFYINRLKTFSVAEIPFRVRQKMQSTWESKVSKGRIVGVMKPVTTVKILPECKGFDSKNAGHLHLFGKEVDYRILKDADWHRDVFSGKSFSLGFSKSISIRKDPTLSAKSVWELNRLQFLVPLIAGWKKHNDNDSLELFMQLNESWKRSNPYLSGVNWYSNIEVNLRLITWFLCWEIMDAEELMKKNQRFATFVSDTWQPMIYQHCLYSYKNPSKHSSANNHLISEYAGLYIASAKWNFPESSYWNAYAKSGLENEIQIQHSENGINKEEAAEYIQFITDFFLLPFIIAKNLKQPFSSAFSDQLHKILLYISSLLDCKGNFPKYGDEDDGKCFIIDDDHSFNNFQSLLTAGAILFNDVALKKKSNKFDQKNRVLFGDDAEKLFDDIAITNQFEQSAFYASEGHFICRKQDASGEIYLNFDAAPLGFLSIAAHGHADALSFMLHINGEPFLVDPGTYTYHTDPIWRNYFIGTLAHNTIRINRENQASIAGSTLWLKHYTCSVIESSSNELEDFIWATHNGYARFGIMHTRKLLFDKKRQLIKITDEIESSSIEPYSLEMPFHLHPQINVEQHGKIFNLRSNTGKQVRIKLPESLTKTLHFGQVDPELLGWYSPSFLKKEPTNCLICTCKTSGNLILETEIIID